MTGRGFKPLNLDEIKSFEKAAKEASNPIRTLTGRLLLHTGMRNGEFNHMRPWWLLEKNGKYRIDIPRREECVGGVGPAGFGNENSFNMNDRGKPCSKCRNKAHREDNRWTCKTRTSDRTIPINSKQEDLVDLLKWWKDGYDYLPLSHRSVNYQLEQLTKSAGLDRRVTAHDLRHTHGTMLARMDWTAVQIMDRLGHGSIQMPRKYITYTAQASRDLVEEKYDLDNL